MKQINVNPKLELRYRMHGLPFTVDQVDILDLLCLQIKDLKRSFRYLDVELHASIISRETMKVSIVKQTKMSYQRSTVFT